MEIHDSYNFLGLHANRASLDAEPPETAVYLSEDKNQETAVYPSEDKSPEFKVQEKPAPSLTRYWLTSRSCDSSNFTIARNTTHGKRTQAVLPCAPVQ